jgi:molybdopterin-biosynthesis enzyme MoeA-like protein
MPESVLVQAQVPKGAVVFPNEHGTAPGLAIEVSPNTFHESGKPAWLLMLPGPPRELRPMVDDQALPFIKNICRSSRRFIAGHFAASASVSRWWRTCCLGNSSR